MSGTEEARILLHRRARSELEPIFLLDSLMEVDEVLRFQNSAMRVCHPGRTNGLAGASQEANVTPPVSSATSKLSSAINGSKRTLIFSRFSSSLSPLTKSRNFELSSVIDGGEGNSGKDN